MWECLKKLMALPFDPAVSLLGICPKEPKTLIAENIITPMFIEALITIAKLCKQSRCPSVDEWIKQPWDIYTLKYYPAIKKEENFALCDSMYGPGEHYAK